jgi:asparagine synthase (glutamine-hydrolysing)
LSGDGGDELFGGYDRYVTGSRLSAILARVPRALRQGAAHAVLAVPVAAWDTAARIADSCLPGHFNLTRAGNRGHRLATIILGAEDAEVYLRLISIWQEPCSLVNGTAIENPVINALRSVPKTDFVLRMMYADSVTYLPDDILTKVDRASMAVGLEARVPLLDHRVYEFAWRLPLAWKLRNGQTKHLLRQVLCRYVPKSLIERPKMGFGVPIGDWLRGDLRDWADALLAEDRLRRDGLFDPAPIRRCWAEHLSGRSNWKDRLWTVLMFQAWHERWHKAA